MDESMGSASEGGSICAEIMSLPGSKDDLSPAKNVAIIRRVRYQPRHVLFSTLSRLWVIPSAGSILVFLSAGNTWSDPGSWEERLARVRFEQWVALGILTAQFVFVYLALHYRRVESFREEVIDPSKPDDEPPNPSA